MCIELQGRGWYVNLSSGINTTRNINGRTHVHTFFNNLRLGHKCAVRKITKYLVSTSTYVNLQDINQRLTICGVVYRTDIENCIECYVDSDSANRWAQEDDDNTENIISCTGYVITYVGCTLLWCSKLQTTIALSTTESKYIALIQAMRKVIPFM